MISVRRVASAVEVADCFRIFGERSLFASAAFAEVWRSMGGQPVFWLAEVDASPAAALLGIEFRRRPFTTFQAMPNGCYGRLTCSNKYEFDKNEAGRLIADAVAGHGYRAAFISDFWNSMPSVTSMQKLDCETQLVEISGPDWEPPDKKLRQQIRKAESEHLTVLPFGTSQLEDFMQLVELSVNRQGRRSPYSNVFFESLARLTGSDSRVRWLSAVIKSEMASSHIFLVEGNSLIHWQSYYDPELSFTQATKYVPFIAAREAASEGIRTLNLGATPGGAEGVDFYKSKWGGSAFGYKLYYKRSFLGEAIKRLRL